MDGGRRGRDRMIVGFSTACAISTYHYYSSTIVHGEMYSIQRYVSKFFSNLRQVGGFLRVIRFPPPVKLIVMILLKCC